MGENPEIISKGYLSLSLAYIRNEADILKFVDALISNTKGEGKEGDPFWTKSETLLYCALIAYIIFEGPAEDRNMNTLVDMISGMEVKEDDEDFMNAVDYMFAFSKSASRIVSQSNSIKSTNWPAVIYALSDFLIMILSWLVKQSLRAFLFQEVQP